MKQQYLITQRFYGTVFKMRPLEESKYDQSILVDVGLGEQKLLPPEGVGEDEYYNSLPGSCVLIDDLLPYIYTADTLELQVEETVGDTEII